MATITHLASSRLFKYSSLAPKYGMARTAVFKITIITMQVSNTGSCDTAAANTWIGCRDVTHSFSPIGRSHNFNKRFEVSTFINSCCPEVLNIAIHMFSTTPICFVNSSLRSSSSLGRFSLNDVTTSAIKSSRKRKFDTAMNAMKKNIQAVWLSRNWNKKKQRSKRKV